MYSLFCCIIVYRTPAGRKVHFRTKTVAPNVDEALKLAERHLSNDTRRIVDHIEIMEAIEQ